MGSAAFGTTFGPCAFKTNVVTPWDLGTDILLRKTFALPKSATQLTVTGTVDNDATVFVNGQPIGYVQSGFCNENAINLTAPNTALVAGANLLAVRGHGDPDTESYIDQQVTYQVPLYSLCLLYDPAKSVKAGSTIPLKIQLCDASANNLSSPSITVHALSLAKVDNSASAVVEDSGSANPGDDFRYDAAIGGSGGYIFNKSTKGLTSGTWRLTLTVDGDAESAYQLLFDVR